MNPCRGSSRHSGIVRELRYNLPQISRGENALSKPSSIKPLTAALMLLVLMAMLGGGAVRWESITIDEIAHTGAGVSYLQKLDMRMNEEHPPLAKLIATLPLALRGANADYTHASWTFSGNGPFNQYLGEWSFGYWFLMR